MKRKYLNTLSILLVVCLSQTLHAQTKLFFKTDIGLSSVHVRPALPIGARFGYGLGMEALYQLQETDVQIFFNPDISFVKTGYTYYIAAEPNSTVVAKYLRLNLPLIANLQAGNPSHELFFGVGPYLSMPVGGHYFLDATRYKMHYGNTSLANRKATDAGLIMKLMMTHFANTDIQFSIQYNYGLSNLIPRYTNPVDNKMRSRNLYVSFSFPIN